MNPGCDHVYDRAGAKVPQRCGKPAKRVNGKLRCVEHYPAVVKA